VSDRHKKQPCPCGSGAIALRGVCQTCYQRVYRLVQRGDLTWRQAERRGIVLPATGRHANAGMRPRYTAQTLERPYAR
jgi:hypothetical protein